MIRGIPLGPTGEYTGTVVGLLHPFALLTGVTTVALFAMHGAIYLALKTEGEIQARVRSWVNNTIIVFVICYATTTMATLLYLPHMGERIKAHPEFFGLPVLTMLAIANIPREISRGREGRAFISSCAAVFGLMGLVGLGMFPDLVRGLGPATSLTVVQRRIVARHARDDADHRRHRNPAGAGLYDQHLLDLPREGEAGFDVVLGARG